MFALREVDCRRVALKQPSNKSASCRTYVCCVKIVCVVILARHMVDAFYQILHNDPTLILVMVNYALAAD